MFCNECGNQLSEGVTACPNCGTKTTATAKTDNNTESFKHYVDAHIRKTTNFQSAQDLIKNSKPWGFMGKAVCISVLIGIIAAIIEGVFGYIFLIGILGTCIAFIIVPMVSNSKYEKKFSAKINASSDIDIDDLCKFLTNNLGDIDPYFSEWSLVKESGLVPLITNTLAQIGNEVTIGCEYGEKRKHLAEITIKNHPENRQYYISAGYNGFLLSFRWEPLLTRSCLIRTAPILQAAMEYYINYCQVK